MTEFPGPAATPTNANAGGSSAKKPRLPYKPHPAHAEAIALQVGKIVINAGRLEMLFYSFVSRFISRRGDPLMAHVVLMGHDLRTLLSIAKAAIPVYAGLPEPTRHELLNLFADIERAQERRNGIVHAGLLELSDPTYFYRSKLRRNPKDLLAALEGEFVPMEELESLKHEYGRLWNEVNRLDDVLVSMGWPANVPERAPERSGEEGQEVARGEGGP